MLPVLFIAVMEAGGGVQDACVAVDHGKILASDLGQRVPAMKKVAPSETFGYSPAPGQRRVVRSTEIDRFLGRFGVSNSTASQSFCVVRRTSLPTREEVAAAVLRAFAGRQVEVSILQLSELPVPPGVVEFEIAQLPAASSDNTVLWRGTHRDLEGQTRPFWARLRIKEKVCRLVANEALAAARPLSGDLVKREELWEFPRSRGLVGCETDDLSRFIARRPIPAGAVLLMSDIVQAPAVELGKAIKVLVDTGKAELSINGRAEGSGQIGDRVAFTTSLSRRRYVGVVQEKGVVRAVTPTHE